MQPLYNLFGLYAMNEYDLGLFKISPVNPIWISKISKKFCFCTANKEEYCIIKQNEVPVQ
jgi:hypothetical protein